MASVYQGKMRSIIIDTPHELTIKIPSSFNFSYIFFLPVWLAGWGFAGYSVTWNLFTDEVIQSFFPVTLFMLTWTTIWIAVGLHFIYDFLWQLFGSETIIIDDSTLSVKRNIFNFGKTYKYETRNIRCIRGLTDSTRKVTVSGGRSGIGGIVAFDYAGETYRFGRSIDEHEGGIIAELISERYGINKVCNEKNSKFLMRSSITKDENGITIITPSYKNDYYDIYYTRLLFAGWGYGEILLIILLFVAKHPFGVLISFVMWTAVGSFLRHIYLWQLHGKEVVSVNKSTLSIKYDVPDYEKAKKFDIDKIENISVPSKSEEKWYRQKINKENILKLWGIGTGVISFDYFDRRHRFGSRLSRLEGFVLSKKIVEAINKRGHKPKTVTFEMVSTISEGSDGIKIVIPSNKDSNEVSFLSIWLFFWIICEVIIIVFLFSNKAVNDKLFMLFFASIWTAAGFWSLRQYLWKLYGKEIINVNNEVLSIKRDTFSYGRTQLFKLNKIGKFHTSSSGEFWSNGVIKFDYNFDNYSFGSSIDEEEGLIIIEKIERFKCKKQTD